METLAERRGASLVGDRRAAISRPATSLLFRWRAHLPAKHAAIVTAPDLMVHAHDGAAVAEVAFAPWWRRRLAYAFRFPGVDWLMAALVLSAAGAAAGESRVRSGRRDRRPPDRRARRQCDRPGTVRQAASEISREGPRLADLEVMASTEGAPIPRVYGRARLAGQVIWATNLEEVVSTTSQTTGGSGGKGMGAGPAVTTNDDDVFLFRQFRGRPVRRADRRRAARSGPTASRSISRA